MRYWTKPVGGLYIGERLRRPPFVTEYSARAPISIAFVCDVHMSREYPLKSVTRLADTLVALKPDMLILGGDYVEDDGDARAFFEQMARVRPPYGAFAVMGNNDDSLFGGDTNKYRALTQKFGVRLLSNESKQVDTPGGVIELAGVQDGYEGVPNASGLFTRGLDAYRVLVSHAPHTFLLEQADPAPHIMLCGHTHGGQINVMGFTCYSLIGYERYFNFTHIAGKKRVGDTDVIVSRGTGVSKYAVRFGARPEILIIR